MRIFRLLIIVAFVAVSEARATESYQEDRYKIILERAPFGPVIATEGLGATPNFAAQLQLVGFVYSNSVLPQAIVFDKQANRTYFKAEGELIDDVKLVNIDLMARKVAVQKGLEKATLTVEQKPNTPQAGGVPPQVLPQPAAPGQPMPTAPGARRIPFRRSN